MQITLRKLEEKDAPLMLEWMHDPSVVSHMKTDFASKTEADCLAFICAAQDTAESLHLAIAGGQDEYLGTVSLKHIKDGAAEFGITVRRCAMGRGISLAAMQEIMRLGFEDLGLERIYWCVDPENRRAVRFYDKNGFERSAAPENAQGYTEEEKAGFIWYNTERQ